MNRKQIRFNAWRRMCGLPDEQQQKINILELRTTEWSLEFERLMRDRLVLGAIRYGKIHAPHKPRYDRIGSIFKRIYSYQKTGNKEFLVDAANLCLLEFEECRHPNAHFDSIDDGEHVKSIR